MCVSAQNHNLEAFCGATHMESSHEERQSQKVQVGVHKDPFDLVSILLCEAYKTTACYNDSSVCVRAPERSTYQTAAEKKLRPACGSRT